MPVVRIRNLCYGYPPLVPDQPERWVLRGIDLDVARGEFLAIMGPTGAGKTTLCMSLNGLVPQATGGVIRGDVQVLGCEARRTPVPVLAAQVGIVYQDPESQLFSTTVLDEVAFGPENLGLDHDEIVRRVDWALETVHMRELADRSPTELSGGQKQRVAIAAMLAMLPKILVLDEPTANLDPVGRRQVFEVVSQLARERQMTIVLVSHDAEHVAEFADRVAILNEGRIQRIGPPQNVFADTDLLEQAGLVAPQVTQVGLALGPDVCPAPPMTLETCAKHLRDALPATVSRGSAVRVEIPSASIKGPHDPIVSIQDLAYHYNPETELPIPALNGITLNIKAGEFIGVVGANGSGKTTLVKHFNGLLRPTHGSVYVEGSDTRRATIGELARVVGHVFQNPDHQIFSASVREELAYGPRNLGISDQEVDARVADALERLGLRQHADTPPALLGYGLRRLVSIASVYTMRPQVLILDEPTGGLDWRLATRLMRLVRGLNEHGHTIVLVTHDMRLVAENARRLVVMRAGHVLADGPTRQVLADNDVLQQAQLKAPSVTRLGVSLSDVGMPADLLSVAECISAYQALCCPSETLP